tara:strand:+ start:6426 stop:7337 length:912 start_codon:yes stop_codon:yes gene_type:complete
MNTKIIAFAGTKQAGKSTCCNFLHGYQMRCYGVVDGFAITEDGKLIVDTELIDENGEEKKGQAVLDVNRGDMEFAEWAIYSMWPFVKKYSFASALKEISIGLFGLKYDQVYGTEEHKNQIVPHLRWENMPGIVTDKKKWDAVKSKKIEGLSYHKKGPMTVRDFLQYMGTDIMRRIYEPIWVKACIEDIKREEPLLAVIDDCRFENEIEAIQAEGGKVVGLSRSPYKDSHSSEQDIHNNWDRLDAILDNKTNSIGDTNKQIIELMDSWGWLGNQIEPQEQPFYKEEESTPEKRGIHTIKKAVAK